MREVAGVNTSPATAISWRALARQYRRGARWVLMILDEATEGLAPLIVQKIWRVIGQIRETGISTLIVDRNYRKVLAHTDLAVVLEKERVVLGGESAALARDHDALGRYLGV